MTYNFDPDRWLENELEFLKRLYILEKITEQEYNKGLSTLENRYEEMWNRLDGSYRIPGSKI